MYNKVQTYKTKKVLYISLFIFIGLFIFVKTYNNDLEFVNPTASINEQQLEISNKLDKLTQKLFEQQENRLNKLEEDKNRLEVQLSRLNKPPNDLTLREQLAFVYPYDNKQKFPAYIWQCWKYGLYDERFGKDYKLGEEQWAIQNPGFIHELFNDDTLNAIIRYLYINIPDVVKAFESLPHKLLKMDFFKYLILFAKGGVYADVDTLPLKPIPNWLPENVDPTELGMIISIEYDLNLNEEDLNDENEWKNHYARKLQFANWIIQSKPGHPILREMIASITEFTINKINKHQVFIGDERTNKFMLEVMNWTGDGRWTDVILSFFNDYVQSGIFQKITWKDFTRMEEPKLVSDVLVLPINSFNVGANTNDPLKTKPRNENDALAFVKHYRDGVFKIGE